MDLGVSLLDCEKTALFDRIFRDGSSSAFVELLSVDPGVALLGAENGVSVVGTFSVAWLCLAVECFLVELNVLCCENALSFDGTFCEGKLSLFFE